MLRMRCDFCFTYVFILLLLYLKCRNLDCDVKLKFPPVISRAQIPAGFEIFAAFFPKSYGYFPPAKGGV